MPKIRDPGWAYYRDYYSRFTSIEEVNKLLRIGQRIATPRTEKVSHVCAGFLRTLGVEPSTTASFFVVLKIGDNKVYAAPVKTPERTVTFPARVLVAPGNYLYALDYARSTEEEGLNEILIARGKDAAE